MFSASHSPVVHSVHFYDNDEALIARLRAVFAVTLQSRNSGLVIATEEHRAQLINALTKCAVDVRKAEVEGRLIMLDAQELLSVFMVDAMPDAARFRRHVGALVQQAKDAARRGNYGLVAFGDMVALLWHDGNRQAALVLERLWNDLLQ